MSEGPAVSTASTSDSIDRPLRLAFLGNPNSIHLRRWVSFFARRGHHVTLLVADGTAVEPGLPPSIAIERFAGFKVRSAFPPASLLRARGAIRRAVKRIEPDVLDAHFLTINGWHAWMSGFHPYVTTLWGSDVFVAPKRSRVVARMARITLRSADMVFVDADDLRRGALALGAPPSRTETIQFGVDLQQFAPGPDPVALRARLGLKGKRVVFSPRAITPLYRQGIVVEALAQLPPDVVVLMSRSAAQADELEAIENKARTLGVSNRLVMVPEIAHSDMADFYRLGDVVVSVPASDSTSVSVLEALACGRPVVASDLPSIREWLWDLDSAALVPVDDPAATAAALIRALALSPKARADVGARGRSIVAERGDQDRSLGHVEAFYRGLARPAPRDSENRPEQA
jgi:glycosyltransferase involved in cell wall biosynthesis